MPNYDRIRNQLKTGDLVLFSGRSGFSNFIKSFTWSNWSHIGMVIRLPQFDGPLVWESLRIGQIPDALDGVVKNGVQTLSLDQRVTDCTDRMAVRLLNRPVTTPMFDALWELHEELLNRPYEEQLMELVRAVWDGPLGANSEDLTSLFCSELVAVAYQRMGLLPCVTKGGAPSNEYTPAYFSQAGRLDLLGPWELGSEIVVNLEE